MSINLKWQSGYYGKAGRNLRTGSEARSVAVPAIAIPPLAALAEVPGLHEGKAPGHLNAPGFNASNSAGH